MDEEYKGSADKREPEFQFGAHIDDDLVSLSGFSEF